VGSADLHSAVFRWYRRHGRKLPWRGIRNPYRIMISEIMLQQTQVSRVLEKYPLFIKEYPTFDALASAPRAMVIRSWQGMGYNNRAVRLHMLAHVVVERHGGRLPREYDALIALPGIGKYTAHAMLYSAFNQSLPVVDVNIRRLLSRVFWKMPDRSALRPEEEIWPLATSLLPRGGTYDWNQALMDLGATVCTARSPQCGVCPLGRFCKSVKQMQKGDSAPPIVKRKPELTYRGVPARIHRGRIIEALRQVPHGSSMSVAALTRKVFKEAGDRDVHWIGKALAALEKDGLVRRSGRKVGLP
jgi:A/G-specific adenine glycosylase